MPELKEEPMQEIAQLPCVDEAAEEVFRMMMNVACEPVGVCDTGGSEILTAVIGLAGALSGTFVLRMGGAAALHMAGLLTGMEMTEIDSTVKDAVGEVCNMLAGGWKGKTPELAAACMLSVPTIVSGASYRVYTHQAPVHIERCFRFEGSCFSISIQCEAMQRATAGAPS